MDKPTKKQPSHKYATVFSRAIAGVDAPVIQVEVHASNGLPTLTVVGLPEASVKESKDRVRSALLSAGFDLPPKRITINLAPADLPKVGSRYDLPIAIGILVATEQLTLARDLSEYELIGELGLNGEVRAVQGVLSTLLQTSLTQRTLICPSANLAEAGLINDACVFGAHNLLEICQYLQSLDASLLCAEQIRRPPISYPYDLSDVRGQLQAKRVLEICASGRHSLLMVGPPGSGKSMLASRLVTLLPELNDEQAIEVASLHSLAGMSFDEQNLYRRTVQQPHHTSTAASMIGGGSGNHIKPGSLSLAHQSILFLDELPHFPKNVLDALREPLETKQVDIARVSQKVVYPADVQLVCAMNPTPSGYFSDDPKNRCQDTPNQIANYLRKVSGPLLDRIDCQLEIPPVEYDDLKGGKEACSETSAVVRQRVTACQQRQLDRQGCLNSVLSVSELAIYAELSEEANQLFKAAVDKLGFSARAYHRLLRLARTIADMDSQEAILPVHIAEAVGYRAIDKRFKGKHS